VRTWCDQQGNLKSDWSGLDTFTTNGFGSRLAGTPDAWDADVPEVEGMEIYPNPATDQIAITTRGIDNMNLQLEVYNMKGQKMMQLFSLDSSKTIMLNVETLQNGVYLVTLSSASYFAQEKLVIQK